MDNNSAFSHYITSVPEEQLDLGRAALLIAQAEYPHLDVGAYLGRLNTIADLVRARLPAAPSPHDRLRVLNRILFEELGFTGNRDDYYDLRNSFLNDVLDRKLGIPITLSVIAMEIGRRLGISLQGVNFPGHFLLKWEHDKGDLLLDPFNGGIPLGEAELARRLAQVSSSHKPSREHLLQMLASVSKREILARMLRNLKTIYLRRSDLLKALLISSQILLMFPESAMEIRDRGLILEQLECPQAAASDYGRYLQMAPNATDHEEILKRLAALKAAMPRYN